jgi:phage terminase large subunit
MEIRLEDIESFEYIDLQEVYDINVEENHNYHLANGLLVHNSSKTYSILQFLIFLCLTNDKLKISIVRKSLPTLKGSVLRDFVDIMQDLELYSEKNHNKTQNIYTFQNKSTIEFFSVDDEQKLRGRKRDILYINEANELNYDEFNQLMLRTSKTAFLDYNPSDVEHFIYDLIEENNAILIKTTYKDNPFLSQSQIEYIENLINVDENYYKIYALGEKPSLETKIYSHFKQYIDEPNEIDSTVYGLDFGYNHPTVLVECKIIGEKVYVKELIYENKLTSSDLILKMDKFVINDMIYADYARPEIIEDIKRAGYSISQANKSVNDGINTIKSKEIYVHYESINLWREFKLYCWKKKGEQILDEPVKMYDDGMDALRYAIHSIKNKSEFYFDFSVF